MKKLNSICISSALCLFLCAGSISAQSLSVSHTAAGALESEIIAALDGADPTTITQLTISGETLDDTDASYLRKTFATTLESLDLTGVTFADNRLTNKLCQNMKELKTVSVPTTLTIIGQYSFANCSKLETIAWGAVENIDDYAFQNCSKLQLESLPESLTRVGQSGFSKCTSITIAQLPTQLTGIGTRAFEFCTGVTIQQLPEGTTEIKERAFDRTGITNLTFPESVSNIGNLAFYAEGNPERTFVYRGENAPKLGDRSFGTATAISNTTVKVLKKYADNHSVWTTAGMNLGYLTHNVTLSIQGDGLVELTGNGLVSPDTPIEDGVTIEAYEGESITLSTDKEATVSLNGEPVSPDQESENRYTIAVGTDDIALEITFSISTGIEKPSTPSVTWSISGNTLYLSGELSTPAQLFNIMGSLVLSTTEPAIDLSTLPAGIYIVKVNSQTFKIVRP